MNNNNHDNHNTSSPFEAAPPPEEPACRGGLRTRRRGGQARMIYYYILYYDILILLSLYVYIYIYKYILQYDIMRASGPEGGEDRLRGFMFICQSVFSSPTCDTFGDSTHFVVGACLNVGGRRDEAPASACHERMPFYLFMSITLVTICSICV